MTSERYLEKLFGSTWTYTEDLGWTDEKDRRLVAVRNTAIPIHKRRRAPNIVTLPRCDKCEDWGAIERFRGQNICRRCLNPVIPPGDPVVLTSHMGGIDTYAMEDDSDKWVPAIARERMDRNDLIRKARKDYTCAVCGSPILRGSIYHVTGMSEKYRKVKFCPGCADE